MVEVELVYPVTAMVSFGGDNAVVLNFETVEEWQSHIEDQLNGAMQLLDVEIVPADENKKQDDMFNPFSILFNFEQSGQKYGSVTSQMRMPVPARTMLQ